MPDLAGEPRRPASLGAQRRLELIDELDELGDLDGAALAVTHHHLSGAALHCCALTLTGEHALQGAQLCCEGSTALLLISQLQHKQRSRRNKRYSEN